MVVFQSPSCDNAGPGSADYPITALFSLDHGPWIQIIKKNIHADAASTLFHRPAPADVLLLIQQS